MRPVEGEETMGHHAERGVVVEASPTTALEVVQTDLPFQYLIVTLYPPAQLGQTAQLLECCL
ncbi:hypothetical protein D7W79_01710 [Corallococcus exercitus]|nr:hypothetical protein D7W79_01710 [Corallococcus exercitus]